MIKYQKTTITVTHKGESRDLVMNLPLNEYGKPILPDYSSMIEKLGVISTDSFTVVLKK
jgi:hypothetical protein